MTDRPSLDPATEARLARLGERRGGTATSSPTARTTSPPAGRPSAGAPAAASKIVAAGASTMAVLGMMTVFGLQARATSGSEVDTASPVVAGVTEAAPASDQPPILVVVLDESGRSELASLSAPETPERVSLAVPAPRQVTVASAATNAPRPQATSRGS